MTSTGNDEDEATMKARSITTLPTVQHRQAMFEVRDVSMTYRTARGQVHAVSDVTLDVHRGEFLSLIGPSGCGKSTLLEILGGMRRPTAGSVSFDGESITGPRPERISFVFQNYSLFPWRSVLRNVEAGMQFQGVSKAERRDRARASLQLVGMDDFRDAYPSECSGGMQQRVAIARALACEPDVLLMDEPFGALDEQTRLVLGEELGRVLDTTNCTIVFVTHSLSEAVLLSDRVVVMQTRPGRIRHVYDVEADRPRTGDFMATRQFAELHKELFETLRDEIRASDRAGAASPDQP